MEGSSDTDIEGWLEMVVGPVEGGKIGVCGSVVGAIVAAFGAVGIDEVTQIDGSDMG